MKFLELLAKGTYAEYSAFIATPEATAFLAAHNIPISTVQMNMIGLILASTFVAGSTLPYAEVGTAIGLSDEVEIEEAVVEAAALGQVDAKINQKESTIRFDSIRPRTLFTATSAILEKRLGAFKDALITSRKPIHETIVKSATL